MKTVILTSSGFLFESVREILAGVLPVERPLQVAYVPTASRVVKDDAYARRDVRIMEGLGFEVEELDLAEAEPGEVEAVLRRNRVVYAQGGNGFYLLKHARRTGFLAVAKRLVEAGELIYVGKSAGSYLACPTLEVHTWHSDKWNRFGVEDLTGMGLVDFLVQAHYSEEDDEAIMKGMAGCAYPLRLLTNEQVLVVRDGVVAIL